MEVKMVIKAKCLNQWIDNVVTVQMDDFEFLICLNINSLK